MKEENLKRLQADDDALRCDGPADCDWAEIEARVRLLKPEVEQFFNIPFWMEDGVQDASFVAGLGSEDRVVCIRFSTWGNFFTIWDDSPERPLKTSNFKPVIDLIEKHGFVHVDYDDLGERYQGPNEHYNKENWYRYRRRVKVSWWQRYFDYT